MDFFACQKTIFKRCNIFKSYINIPLLLLCIRNWWVRRRGGREPDFDESNFLLSSATSIGSLLTSSLGVSSLFLSSQLKLASHSHIIVKVYFDLDLIAFDRLLNWVGLLSMGLTRLGQFLSVSSRALAAVCFPYDITWLK